MTILDLKQKIRELDAEVRDCPGCPNIGFYTVHDSSGFPELQQCEFCYREPNSRFNRFTFYQEALPTLLAYCEELEGKLGKYRDAMDAIGGTSHNELAEVKAKLSNLESAWLDAEQEASDREGDNAELTAQLAEAKEKNASLQEQVSFDNENTPRLMDQLLAAQTVNAKKDKALAIALSVIRECDPDTVRQYAPIIKEALALTPDPTLLDEVVKFVQQIHEVMPSPESKQLLSRLRQSTRET